MRNAVLAASIASVMSSPSPAQFLLKIDFLSKTNSKFAYTPLIVDNLVIKQDFAHEYADNIVISFMVASADYATIQDNAEGLLAVLTITSLDRLGSTVYNPPPQQYIYQATIVNPKDIRRQLSDVSQRTLPDTTISIRLIDQTIYDLRHINIHGIYQNTTLADVMSHIAQTFNFKTLHLVPPDNTHTYDHIVIPPNKNFSEVFTYLQKTYGVYMKGLNFYGSNGVLYIYPPYETGPTFPQTCVVYQADDGAYAGAQAFHKTTGTTTEIVVNRESFSQDITVTSGENKGTASMFLRSSALVDGVVTVDETKGVQYQTGLSASLRLQNPRLASGNAQHTTYAKATDNPFSMATALASGQAVMVAADWGHAVPFLLLPGCTVRYSYDQDGVQMTQTGILEGVQCDLNRDARVGAGVMYLSSGKLILRLQPDPAVTG